MIVWEKQRMSEQEYQKYLYETASDYEALYVGLWLKIESMRDGLVEKYGEKSNQLIRVHWVVSELNDSLNGIVKTK